MIFHNFNHFQSHFYSTSRKMILNIINLHTKVFMSNFNALYIFFIVERKSDMNVLNVLCHYRIGISAPEDGTKRLCNKLILQKTCPYLALRMILSQFFCSHQYCSFFTVQWCKKGNDKYFGWCRSSKVDSGHTITDSVPRVWFDKKNKKWFFFLFSSCFFS